MKAVIWVTLARGCFAMTLGAALLLEPEHSQSMLANFMGMYWLVSGIVSVRWARTTSDAPRLAIVAGMVGAITGVIVLFRNVVGPYEGKGFLLGMLGVVIVLTGVLHAFGGFTTHRHSKARHRTTLSMAVGVLEIVLGTLLILSRATPTGFIYWAAAAWGLCGGALLIIDALHERRLGREDAAQAPSVVPDTAAGVAPPVE